MSEIIILPILARHFKDTDFTDHLNCEISKAAKEFFKVPRVSEGKDNLFIEKHKAKFKHKWYSIRKSKSNHALAAAAGYNDTIIFNLELKEVV